MRYVIIIILSLLIYSCKTTKPPVPPVLRPPVIDYVIRWKSNGEMGVVNYMVQRSPTKSRWSTLATIMPRYLADSNWYSFTLPTTKTAYFYRILANMNKKKTYQTNPIFIKP